MEQQTHYHTSSHPVNRLTGKQTNLITITMPDRVGRKSGYCYLNDGRLLQYASNGCYQHTEVILGIQVAFISTNMPTLNPAEQSNNIYINIYTQMLCFSM